MPEKGKCKYWDIDGGYCTMSGKGCPGYEVCEDYEEEE